MSTSVDQSELLNLTSATHSGESFDPSMMYKSAEFNYFSDQNQQQYSSGRIVYDSLPLLNTYVVWADSYIVIPLTISSSGGAYSNGSPLAFKTSALSLISGLLVQSGDGQTLVNDPQNLQYINNLRLLLETTFDAVDNLENLQVFPETRKQNFAVPALAVPGEGNWECSTAPLTALRATNDPYEYIYNGGTIDRTNPLFNEGFSKRIQLWKSNASFNVASGTFSMLISIPLAFIHPFFKALNFPIVNTRFQITFYTPVTNSATALTSNTPLLVGPAGSSGAANLSDPLVSIATVTEASTGASVTGTRIYYKKVNFDPETAKMLAAKMEAGFTRTIQFNLTDFYQLSNGTNVAGNTEYSLNDIVTPSVIAPVRCWQISVPTGFANSNSIPFVSIVPSTNSNILVNNSPYFQNNLLLDEEHFDLLRQQSVQRSKVNSTEAGLIDFRNFKLNYRVLCFDLSRLGERLRDPTQACSLQVRCTARRSNGEVAYDRFYLVERSQVVKMDVSNSAVKFDISSSYL